jgi:hypothetical protein
MQSAAGSSAKVRFYPVAKTLFKRYIIEIQQKLPTVNEKRFDYGT